MEPFPVNMQRMFYASGVCLNEESTDRLVRTVRAYARRERVRNPNLSSAPLFGTVNLNAGFSPDPYTTNVTAGGGRNAAEMGLASGCVGFITTAQPDVRLNYQASSLPLTVRATASADTTLVINGPDGGWYCNDDANDINPAVSFPSPRSGQYDIWVGTWSNRSAPARLNVSEMR